VSAWLLRLGRLRRLCAHKRMHRDGAAVMCAGRSVHAHALHAHCTQQWLLQTRTCIPATQAPAFSRAHLPTIFCSAGTKQLVRAPTVMKSNLWPHSWPALLPHLRARTRGQHVRAWALLLPLTP
jgi:hypothetical protein